MTEEKMNDSNEFLLEAEEEKKEQLKVNPELLTAIVVSASQIMDDNPKESRIKLLFMVVKQFINTTMINTNRDANLSAIFVYFIEAQRTLKVVEDNEKNPDNPTNPLKFYKDSVISVFDLYLENPADITIRRLVAEAGYAIQENVSAIQNLDNGRPMKDVFAHLTNLAMFTQTVKSYVKGAKRERNYIYIKWLRALLYKALSTDDLSFMVEDKEVSSVLEQVRKGHTVITIPSLLS